MIFVDSFIPDPVVGPSAHGSILRDITNGACGDAGVTLHGEFHGPCGRKLESGSQFGPKDLQVGFRSPASTQSAAALVSSHAGSLLSKGGSCRTLSGDPASNASTVLSSSAAPAGPPFKRPRALSNSKPHSRRHDARAHSRLLACTVGDSLPAGRLTCFDKVGGAATVSKPLDFSLEECQFLCMGRSTVVRPLARLLTHAVPNWPHPQVIVSSAALAATHRAPVLTTDSGDPPLVVEAVLQGTFLSLMTDVTFGLGYTLGTRLGACTANGITFDCLDVIPANADLVHVTLLPPPPLMVSTSGSRSLSTGTSSEDDAPLGWELGRKKRSTAPNVDTSQPATQRTSGTQGVQPWAEQPVPGAPAVQVVSGSASSTTNTAPFSVFDYAAGAAVKPRPPGLTAEQCLRRAISDSYVANPIGRLLNTEVPGWPTPQALVFEYRVLRTHIACVVVIAGFFENPFVLQVPLHSTMHRVLALTPVGGDLALVRCLVDNAPIHCDAFLPEGIDYVFFEVTARPAPCGVRPVEQRPLVSVTEPPEAALGQASSSSTDVAFGLLPTRPATPPIPEDP